MKYTSPALLILSTLLTCIPMVSHGNQPEPEAATGYHEKQGFTGSEFMVSAANPYASWAGKKILEQGGVPLMPR